MNYETVILDMLKEMKNTIDNINNEQININDRLSNLDVAIASIKDEFMEFQERNEKSHNKLMKKIEELEKNLK